MLKLGGEPIIGANVMSKQFFPRSAMVLLAILPSPVFAQSSTKNVYVQHNLVSDIAGMADVTDPNLVDPWGVSETATSPFWVSNHNKGVATIYNGSGTITPTVVTIPPGAGNPSPSSPTGQVTGNGANWTLPAPNGKVASFIFATEDGTISAWNGSAGTTAVKIIDNSAAGAVYKGLASNPTGSTPMLYAANFFTGNIDVFDADFNPTTVAGGFTDSNLPAGFAPFNISNLGGKLYVMYAKQAPGKKLDAAGPGNGFVDIFDINGNLLQRLVSNGALNSPWGVAIAPANWGAFGGDVLVGNFGDGKINAFDPKSGNLIGTLQDQNGNPIVNTGLWAILFGNGKSGGDPNTLYFVAGITGADGNTDGLLAAIAPPSQITQITNGASFVAGSIAPGEVVLLNGFTIGPSPLVSAAIPSSGTAGSTAGATSVTFNGAPAPILYASASATSVVVPYEVSGFPTANVVVTYKNNPSATFTAQVVFSAPGLFTSNESGSGQIVAINSDNTINSSTNAATAGSAVLLFATGEGPTDPPGQDGAITSEFFHEPVLPVSLTIGGQPATVVFAGSAPGLIAGVMEVEAIVPTGAGAGAVPVVLTVGSRQQPAECDHDLEVNLRANGVRHDRQLSADG